VLSHKTYTFASVRFREYCIVSTLTRSATDELPNSKAIFPRLPATTAWRSTAEYAPNGICALL
jgi:hypothetical protein